MNRRITAVREETCPGSARIMAAYGLDLPSYTLGGAGEEDAEAWIRQQLLDRTWFVISLPRPHRIHGTHGLRPLEEPKSLLGVADMASPVVSAEGLRHIRPDALDRLEGIYLGTDGTEETETLVTVRGLSYLQAADRYLSDRPGIPS